MYKFGKTINNKFAHLFAFQIFFDGFNEDDRQTALSHPFFGGRKRPAEQTKQHNNNNN
jgi:hypothetical protein